IIHCARQLNLSIIFIATYTHNPIANHIFSSKNGFPKIPFEQVNPILFSNKTFTPTPPRLYLRYHTFIPEKTLQKSGIFI
ncbi:hypothetical protein ACQZV8_20735, partial [Magnetococcales bacterium HHB-1]